MQLRFVEDYRTLVWAFVLFPLVPALGFFMPALLPWLVPFALYLAYCAGVLTHNHVHCPVFRERRMNEIYSAWLSIFYGCPIFVWFPTHNGNHHKYLNGEGDVTQTTRHSPEDTLWNALSYPVRSAFWQAPTVLRYARTAKRRGALHFKQVVVQSTSVVAGHAALLTLGLFYGGTQGGLVYALLVLAPALFAPYAMMLTNYLQHVGCDPESPHDHSRNFVGPLWNFFVFDAGYHTVHHEEPGLHWSRLAERHHARQAAIDPALNPSSPLSYCFQSYGLGLIRAGSNNSTKSAST